MWGPWSSKEAVSAAEPRGLRLQYSEKTWQKLASLSQRTLVGMVSP